MSTPQANFYKANKDKVLSYKKQYYQEKNKAYIALKKFCINEFSKRDSDIIIKSAIDNFNPKYNNFNISFMNNIYNLEEFINKYDIDNNIKVEAYLASGDIEGTQHILSYLVSEVIERLQRVDDENTPLFHLYLYIKLPLIEKN